MLESVVVRNKLKFIILLFCFFSSGLFAQTESSNQSDLQTTSSKESKKIVIQFDNELIDGKRESPELDYLFIRKEANYKKMMKLRDNFLPEVKKGKRDFSGSK